MINAKGALLVLVLFFAASTASAMKGTDHGGHNMSGHKTDHGAMSNGNTTTSGHFKYVDKADGVHAVFQVMSLASMKMKDPEGKTHHIMVSLSKNNQKLKQATGDIVVVSPSGKKQRGKLMHFGGGMYAANFTFDEAGEWVIKCRFTGQGTDYTKKFSYPHHDI